ALAAGVAAAVWSQTSSAALGLAAALAAALLAALLTAGRALGSAQRTMGALADGIRSFRDGEFSMRLANPREDELGDLVGLYNEMGDAMRSERHDLYQRELMLETVLQGAPMAIVLTGPTGRVAYSNRSARHLLHHGRRLEGHDLQEVLAQAPAEMREVMASAEDALFTVADTAGGEETYHLSRRSFDLHTRRHTLFVVERLTPELRRREVEVWKKAIRVMNHEMNNSLAPIRSLVRSARTATARPEHAHHLEGIFDTIEERATYLSEFLEGYARFARLPRPQKRPVPWREFLEGMRHLAAFRVQEPLPERPGLFDPSQMQQVLINLVKNAREAGSPEGEIVVAVQPGTDGSAALQVLDRGRGMDEEVMRRALLPFYSSKPSGTGLGLPLCQEIVEAHGGRLRLQARPGGGLAVTCLLPG
ncbi:MAG TPA: ATP-binding protein, partial [Vicinamibacteria bacterium]|nr:ATP-binding protein [Vicinamibacteria bacterium]